MQVEMGRVGTVASTVTFFFFFSFCGNAVVKNTVVVKAG